MMKMKSFVMVMVMMSLMVATSIAENTPCQRNSQCPPGECCGYDGLCLSVSFDGCRRGGVEEVEAHRYTGVPKTRKFRAATVVRTGAP
ncbi:hypothetical protein SOVF_089670 [Spinacia oleracea]|nr:hypothetical protein SOVF_089670 [Spinacia oleracea]